MALSKDELNALNPYINGPFAPIGSERTFLDLKVTGEFPKDLLGAYYRAPTYPAREIWTPLKPMTVFPSLNIWR